VFSCKLTFYVPCSAFGTRVGARGVTLEDISFAFIRDEYLYFSFSASVTAGIFPAMPKGAF